MTQEIEYATKDQFYEVVELIKLQQDQINSLQKQINIMLCKTPEELKIVLRELGESE